MILFIFHCNLHFYLKQFSTNFECYCVLYIDNIFELYTINPSSTVKIVEFFLFLVLIVFFEPVFKLQTI